MGTLSPVFLCRHSVKPHLIHLRILTMNFQLHNQLPSDQLDSLPEAWMDTLSQRDDIVAIYDVLRTIQINYRSFSTFALADLIEVTEGMTEQWADGGEDSTRGVFVFTKDAIDYGNAIELLIEALSAYYEEVEPDEKLIEAIDAFDTIQAGLRRTSIAVFDSEYEVPDEISAVIEPFDLQVINLSTTHQRRLEYVTLSGSILFIIRYDEYGRTHFPLEQVVAFGEAIKKGKSVLVLELGREEGSGDTVLTEHYKDVYVKAPVAYFTGKNAAKDFCDFLMKQIPKQETIESENEDESY